MDPRIRNVIDNMTDYSLEWDIAHGATTVDVENENTHEKMSIYFATRTSPVACYVGTPIPEMRSEQLQIPEAEIDGVDTDISQEDMRELLEAAQAEGIRRQEEEEAAEEVDEVKAFEAEMQETLTLLGLTPSHIEVVRAYCSSMVILATKLIAQGEKDVAIESIARATERGEAFQQEIKALKTLMGVKE